VDKTETHDEFNAQGCEVPEQGRRAGGSDLSVVAAEALRLADLVRTVGGVPFDAYLAEMLLERADRILAKDGRRDCKRVLIDEEIDVLLAGDEPEDAT